MGNPDIVVKCFDSPDVFFSFSSQGGGKSSVFDSDKIPLSCSTEPPYVNIFTQCELIPRVYLCVILRISS